MVSLQLQIQMHHEMVSADGFGVIVEPMRVPPPTAPPILPEAILFSAIPWFDFIAFCAVCLLCICGGRR